VTLDGHAADIDGDVPSHGSAVNLIAATASDVAEVRLRVVYQHPIVAQSLALFPSASAHCGIYRLEQIGLARAVDETV
jgi:hypothetical protein